MEIVSGFIITYILLINLWLFTLMGMDKRRSRREKWRIKEKTLWAFAFLGGSLGGWLGMNVFRHKTKHRPFKIGLPVLTILHLIAWGYLLNQFYL
ncbi:DUF1294 domain-containing protein [Halobacillus mangrovi]|uniref:DUF1294 domain-containing protein n=1 Tax=Halobacillus mangrovi TaxID=402384 RepID=A0A1W5ZU57_9BACI|nr:DUF1294 domain-containing protein [Halobacillus mangrovi]ARI76844.1 hypothetical protein HM131_08310 [Halobacillus mangrovi]